MSGNHDKGVGIMGPFSSIYFDFRENSKFINNLLIHMLSTRVLGEEGPDGGRTNQNREK